METDEDGESVKSQMSYTPIDYDLLHGLHRLLILYNVDFQKLFQKLPKTFPFDLQ